MAELLLGLLACCNIHRAFCGNLQGAGRIRPEFGNHQDLAKLDEAFKLIEEQPLKVTGRHQDAFVEDFRRVLAENPIAVGEAALRIGKG